MWRRIRWVGILGGEGGGERELERRKASKRVEGVGQGAMIPVDVITIFSADSEHTQSNTADWKLWCVIAVEND